MKKKHINNKIIQHRSSILLGMFILIATLLIGFLITIFNTINSNRNTFNKYATIKDRAIRGSIISADGYFLSYSQKLYRAEVNTRSIDPKRKDIFVNLFSIYSGIPKEDIEKRFKNKNGKYIKGRIVLSRNIDIKLASELRSLGRKMSKLKVFRPLNKNKPHLILGLDIIEDSENRYFPHRDILTPVVGYMQIRERRGYRFPIAMKGLEKEYDSYLSKKRDGLIRGKRDLIGTVIRTGSSENIKRVDGMDLHLNIALDFQKSVERVIDRKKKEIDAEEILVAVMDSSTGQVLSMATSERFNPAKIHNKDLKALNPNFTEYVYEPGSVIKPLTLAIAIDNDRVDLYEEIRLGGKYRVNERYTITDDIYHKSLTPRGILMYSSNIGIAKIAWELSGKEIYDGFRAFGLDHKSGIDLSKELTGKIKAPYLLDYPTYSANSAYGYGMQVTFVQLLKAYSAFNNKGIAVTPEIVDYLSDNRNIQYNINVKAPPLKACLSSTAESIYSMLLDVVEAGTGITAQYDGLEVGGKTGTAHITYKGKYVKKYHSSFFGFANDKFGHKYTIGVLVIKPKKVHFASDTAAPVCHDVIQEMVNFKYLIPDKNMAKWDYQRRIKKRRRVKASYRRRIERYNRKHKDDNLTR